MLNACFNTFWLYGIFNKDILNTIVQEKVHLTQNNEGTSRDCSIQPVFQKYIRQLHSDRLGSGSALFVFTTAISAPTDQ